MPYTPKKSHLTTACTMDLGVQLQCWVSFAPLLFSSSKALGGPRLPARRESRASPKTAWNRVFGPGQLSSYLQLNPPLSQHPQHACMTLCIPPSASRSHVVAIESESMGAHKLVRAKP